MKPSSAANSDALTWDFDRVIVGHNAVAETNGKEGLKKALANKDMLLRFVK